MQPRLSDEDFTTAAPGACAGLFCDREVAALAWTQTLTDLSPRGASSKACAALFDQFSRSEAMFLSVAIAAVDNWNRLGAALRLAPPRLRALGA
jgi:alkylhydroperoxidase family enzyme